MTMTLDISDDLKPEEASELVEIAREQRRPVGRLLLEAAREIVRVRKSQVEQPQTQAA